MKQATVNHLTKEQCDQTISNFDERGLLPLHSLSDVINRHPHPNAITDGLAMELLVSIFRTAGAVHKAQEPMFRKHNMVSAGWRTLGALYFHTDRAMPLHEISTMLALTRPYITGVIDSLEQEGLVERVAKPGDRRTIIARLTDKGVARMEELSPEYNALVAAIFHPFSDAEKEQLLQMLLRLRTHIAESLMSAVYPAADEQQLHPEM